MSLLDRVARLVRANLNDLIDRAEDPQKLLKQVILDMQNQLLQLKTQVAITLADRHLLEKKLNENSAGDKEYLENAERALAKGREDLARVAVENALTHRKNAEICRQQLEDQKSQVEHLKNALRNLEIKMAEAQQKSELLIAQQRRARALGKASDLRLASGGDGTLVRMNDKVQRDQALSEAKAELAGDDLHEQLLALGRQDQIEQILAEIKARKSR